jgi:hypothetical protein
MTADGRLRLFPRLGHTATAANRDRTDISPWNAALAHCNFLLDAAFAPRRRHGVNHVPLLIEKRWWQEMTERWSEDIARTRANRFRKAGTIAPEYLYPWFLLHSGRAVEEPLARTWRDSAYASLENTPFTTALALLRARLFPPKTLALNDGFGPKPRPAVVKAARRFLESSYPVKSRFER